MPSQSSQKLRNDEEYKPNRPSKINPRKKKPKGAKKGMGNSSKWSHEQNARFLEFVRQNKEILICPLKRKEQRVFLHLSRFIITRTPDQCRSHHQKMIKHHKDLDGIIQNLERRLSGYLPPLEIEQEMQAINQMMENRKKDKVMFFFDTKIDVQMQLDQNSGNNIWGILNQEIWVERPIENLLKF